MNEHFDAETLNAIREHEDLLRANEYLHKQLRIIRSFASIYFATWSVDLKKNYISPIAIPAWLDCITLDTKGNAKKAFVYFIFKFITNSPDSRKKMLDFLDIDTLAERMAGDALISCEYFGSTFGWVSANLITVNRDEYGAPLTCIFALRNIDSTKSRELQSEAALKDAMMASERASSAKTEFLSRMSHDIRTPMNAIVGMTQIAQSHIDEKERVADCLDKIATSSAHLLELINEVLDMSRIESGKVVLDEKEFNFLNLLDNIKILVAPLVKAKSHNFTIQTKNLTHKIVIGDALRIERVFVNIISNSIKYTHEGGNIEVNICEKATNTKGVSFFVAVFRDNGIGMSADFVKKIFEPFSREVQTGFYVSEKDRKIEGTGLGMSIAKNLVHLMNGDIKVESSLGAGSIFTVTMYLKVKDLTSEEEALAQKTGTQNPSRALNKIKEENYEGKRVLLAEDNELNSEIASEILSMMKIKVEVACNGREAVEAFKRSEQGFYSLIFMDIQMPIMDGYSATKLIRNLKREDAATIPIVAMTANAFSEDVSCALSAGMNEHISKPLDIDKLKTVLSEWIR